jgi:Cu(I)/Ag(I) efflux system membrane protein CusA/SilA
MVGGMVSSTMLTLVVIPAIYSLWQEYALAHQRPAGWAEAAPAAAPNVAPVTAE